MTTETNAWPARLGARREIPPHTIGMRVNEPGKSHNSMAIGNQRALARADLALAASSTGLQSRRTR
jgi:hypothetical protein